jgi:hypothetical protein
VLSLLLLASLTGCDAQFDVSREQLGPFRVAGLGVVDGVASAAIWSGEGLYHSEAPRLQWSVDGEPVGEGWQVPVSADADLLELAVTDPATGERHLASVQVGTSPGRLLLSRAELDLPRSLSLNDRRDVSGEPVLGTVAERMGARLTVAPEVSTEAELSARWMMASGSVLPLYPLQADVLSETLSWEGSNLNQRTSLGPGIYSGLSLVLDGAGGNSWLWFDVGFGVDTPLLRHGGMLLQGEAPEGSDQVVAVLDWNEAGTRVVPTAITVETEDTVFTPMDCVAETSFFEMSWIAEGRCTVDDVLGATVRLEVTP